MFEIIVKELIIIIRRLVCVIFNKKSKLYSGKQEICVSFPDYNRETVRNLANFPVVVGN